MNGLTKLWTHEINVDIYVHIVYKAYCTVLYFIQLYAFVL